MRRRIGAAIQITRENSTSTFVKVAGSDCAAAIFFIRYTSNLQRMFVAPSRSGKRKSPCADSESRFLAIKKFSGKPWTLAVRRSRADIFLRIAKCDSQSASSAMVRCHDRPVVSLRANTQSKCATCGRPRCARRRLSEIASSLQRPSFALSRSLTACGLALPPDAFIT